MAAIWLAPILAGGLWAQKPPLSARDLYYDDPQPSPAANTHSSVPATPAAARLGLRYNLVKIDPATRAEQAVDPSANFKEGDCFAIELTPNHDGRLYVFNLGSSGKPQFLMPSPEMPSEASAVLANTTVRIPRDYCFQLDGKRGVESLTVATVGAQELVDPGNPSQAIAQVREWQGMAGRDILIEKTAETEKPSQPEAGHDRPYTVYAVENAPQKNGRVVVEIRIRHE